MVVETNKNDTLTKYFIILIVILISLIYIIYNIYPILQLNQIKIKYSDNYQRDNISSLLNSYIITRNRTFNKIEKRIFIKNETAYSLPMNYDYIEFIKDNNSIIYPYSTWKCSNTSNTIETSREYCILTNIYYNSKIDRYYFYENPLLNQTNSYRHFFQITAEELQIHRITNLKELNDKISSILIRPILVGDPPDLNYMHGFLEVCGPRFWVLSECQYHSSYINPSKIQIYYTSTMFNIHNENWNRYEQQSDKTYRPKRQWEQIIHSMFSIYPLLIYRSFNETIIMFKYMIFPGQQSSRSVTWGYTHLARQFQSYPFSTEYYRRAYLNYSEWILFHLNLKSKFEENYQNEWIVVLNRYDTNIRRINNGKYLIKTLLKHFPNHLNPYLRVWPKEYDFNENFYQSVRMARSIRLLIAVHGAGLANTLFMRPGTIVYEINPYGCRHLSFYYRRWIEIFNLQYALWIPSFGERKQQDDHCGRNNAITLNIQEIIDEIKNLLKNEQEYRNGYLQRAFNIINDLSFVDSPPLGYEDILS